MVSLINMRSENSEPVIALHKPIDLDHVFEHAYRSVQGDAGETAVKDEKQQTITPRRNCHWTSDPLVPLLQCSRRRTRCKQPFRWRGSKGGKPRKVPHSTFLEAKGAPKKVAFPLSLRGRGPSKKRGCFLEGTAWNFL